MKKTFKRLVILVVILTLIFAGIFAYNKVLKSVYPIKYSEYVEQYATEFDLDPAVIYAVIKCESSFDPNAESGLGAKGLMQLMPDAFSWAKTKYDGYTGETDLTDPQTNIKYGCLVLKLHYDEFGDYKTAVTAYHAGRGKVNEWLENPDYSSDGKTLNHIPYADTESYANRVMNTVQTYKNIYDFEKEVDDNV